MNKNLIFKDKPSDLFWNFEVIGNSISVTYGIMGTKGVNEISLYENEEKCLNEAEKLIAEKLRSGFIETENFFSRHLNQWEQLIDAGDLTQGLIAHFSYLADSPGFQNVLESVMKQAFQVVIVENTLQINFPDREVLIAYEPMYQIPEHYPESYKNLLKRHSFIGLSSRLLMLGDHGNFNEEDGWFKRSEDFKSLGYETPEEVLSPLYDYTDCWLYHSTEKNPSGQPVIYYLKYKNGLATNPQTCNAGSLFLIHFAKSMGLDFEIQE